MLALTCAVAVAKEPTKGLLFFYKMGNWVDNYLTKDIDTNYIALPEHSWRLAFITAMPGVNSNLTSYNDWGPISILSRTNPSVDVGFNAGYRAFGFGYAWDVMSAYTRRLSFSFGSKYIGVDFTMNNVSNLTTKLFYEDQFVGDLAPGSVWVTNANLTIWYALNSAHYSHNAATKQSYIQRKTAGSLLLYAAYMASQVSIHDTINVVPGYGPIVPLLMSGMNGVQTRQVAVGLGYGINYTPNHGKVLLHISAAALLVAYSYNQISYYLVDSLADALPSYPMFHLRSSFPVHVTGNVRAAVSWEINKWAHLSAWTTGENIRFRSAKTDYGGYAFLSNWLWKVQLTLGVRFGAGRERVNKALEYASLHTMPADTAILTPSDSIPAVAPVPQRPKRKIPEWITGYFWSPKY